MGMFSVSTKEKLNPSEREALKIALKIERAMGTLTWTQLKRLEELEAEDRDTGSVRVW